VFNLVHSQDKNLGHPGEGTRGKGAAMESGILPISGTGNLHGRWQMHEQGGTAQRDITHSCHVGMC
jgi:hypothetical protein